jgi:protein TonB
MAAPSEIDQTLRAPAKIPKNINMMKDTGPPPPPGSASADLSSGSGGNPNSLFGSPTGTGEGTGGPVIAVKKSGPVRISGGVMAGQLVTRVQPTYPAIARSARLSGTVVLAAKISKTGTIEDLSVVSGPAMLTGAAIDAVKQWRYKPYMLNGEPTEVNTTITVNFNLNGG